MCIDGAQLVEDEVGQRRSDNGVLRADTLRYADEIRTPELIGLPKLRKVAATKVNQLTKAIGELTRTHLDMSELQDREAEALKELVQAKQQEGDDLIQTRGLEEEDVDADAGSAKVIDLMEVLRKSLSKSAVVTRADSSALAKRRSRRVARSEAKNKNTTTRQARAKSKRPRKRARPA